MTMAPAATTTDPWRGFDDGSWRRAIDVAGFIKANYTPYTGDDAFLTQATQRTDDLWRYVADLMVVERERGILDVDAKTPSTITSHQPGRITTDIPELIVGLQTDAPLKRAIMPNGGWRMVENGLQGLRVRARPVGQGDLHQVPQDPQRRRLRRLHPEHPGGPVQPHRHRPARRLRPRPDHRRLPARGPVRRRPADRGEAGRAGVAGRPAVAGRDHPRPRGAQRADPRAARADRARRRARLRPAPPGHQRPRGDPVALPGLPRRDQGAERRGHEPGPGLDLPRRLPAARPGRRDASPRSRPRSSSTTS